MTIEGPHSLLTRLLFWGLCPLSFLYGLIVNVRAHLYRSGVKKTYRSSVPVVSVGNVTSGGTGKTPMVDFLIKYLSSRDVKCAVVSRGYGGNYQQKVQRVNSSDGVVLMSPQACGDEPYLLARKNPAVPVYVARERKYGVQAAEQDGARLILLDDGFQHFGVHRNADIVLLDATNPFGNGRLIPAGNLREPLSALQRADLIVLTRSDLEKNKASFFETPTINSRHQPDNKLVTLDGNIVTARECSGKSCLAFAGIAKPEGFFNSLHAFGFRHIEEVFLSDHQEYGQEVLNRLNTLCHNHDFLVTTEKDAVKLSGTSFPIPCCQLGVELSFDDLTPLLRLLDVVLVGQDDLTLAAESNGKLLT